jgi:xylan 1,4-beta-xylosidase
MYSSYTAASFTRKYQLADHFGVNLLGAVTWGFEFEEQPWFAGFREMATNGVDKPVLNVFRMFGMMGGVRVKVDQDNLAYNYLSVRDHSIRGEMPDVNALAAKQDNSVAVIVWNYHDVNELDVPPSPVTLDMTGIPTEKALMTHYRIDEDFSNSYTLWKKMGSPQDPTPEQFKQLEEAGQLHLFTSPQWINTENGEYTLELTLPRQGVSLIKLSW